MLLSASCAIARFAWLWEITPHYFSCSPSRIAQFTRWRFERVAPTAANHCLQRCMRWPRITCTVVRATGILQWLAVVRRLAFQSFILRPSASQLSEVHLQLACHVENLEALCDGAILPTKSSQFRHSPGCIAGIRCGIVLQLIAGFCDSRPISSIWMSKTGRWIRDFSTFWFAM